MREERKGPRVGAPEAAVQASSRRRGWPRSIRRRSSSDPKKGEFYVAVIENPGRPTPDILAEIVPAIVRDLPLAEIHALGRGLGDRRRCAGCARCTRSSAPSGPRPRSRRSCASTSTGSRPATSRTAIASWRPAPITVRRFDDYVSALERAKVVLDADRRKEIILQDASDLAFAQGLELVEDEGLLEEVAGLVEWPVVLMGAFDERFLDIPPRRSARRSAPTRNASCCAIRKTGALANQFILISNLVATDGGEAIVAGNERVVRARLSDAKFSGRRTRRCRSKTGWKS